MDALHELVRVVGFILEVFGVFIVFTGSLASTIWFLFQVGQKGLTRAYQTYRRAFGRSVILGLDFLIAGDIIRTVIVSHTVNSVLVLAIIVVVRAFLSLTLELGVEGRFPWKGSANLP